MRRAWIALGIAGAVVGGALLVTSIAAAKQRSRIVGCASNLRQLWTMQMNWAHQNGSKALKMSDATGKAFWKALRETRPPLVGDDELELLLCRVKDSNARGEIEFWGPPAPVSKLAGGAPVGCDVPGNHDKGGIVLRKSGDVLEYSPEDFDALMKGPEAPIP